MRGWGLPGGKSEVSNLENNMDDESRIQAMNLYQGKKSLQLGVKTEYSNRSLEFRWKRRAHATPGGRGHMSGHEGLLPEVWGPSKACHTLNTDIMNQLHRELAGVLCTVPLSSNIQPLPLQSQPQNGMFVQTIWEMLNCTERKYRGKRICSGVVQFRVEILHIPLFKYDLGQIISL